MYHKTRIRLDYGPRTQWFGRTMLHLLGWRTVGERPAVDRCIFVCAPHTSNWDLLFTLLASYALRVPAAFMMKKSWFFWPLGPLFYWLGGIPVDRSKSNNAVSQMGEAFRDKGKMNLLVPPEGTRKHVKYWKTGFYWIAVEGDAHIMLGFIDYPHKRTVIGGLFKPTGNLEADFENIRAFYQEEAGFTPDYRRERPAT